MTWRGGDYYNMAWNVDTTFKLDLSSTLTMIICSTPVVLVFSLQKFLLFGSLLSLVMLVLFSSLKTLMVLLILRDHSVLILESTFQLLLQQPVLQFLVQSVQLILILNFLKPGKAA